LKEQTLNAQYYQLNGFAGLLIEGVLAYFTHLKCQKRIEDDVADVQKKIFFFCCEIVTRPLVRFIHLVMQEYDSRCLKMYLITLKVFKIC
jgi:hypothetical protein